MKKIVVMLVVYLASPPLFSQTLFTYGPNAVNKDEFLRAYNKNKTVVADKKQSLKEYLALYSRFKLKVKAARELRLDTLQQMIYDLQNFRNQVAEGYMNDEKQVHELLEEAIQRSRKDIHVLHVYVNVNYTMSAPDSVKAYKAMEEMAGRLKEGKTNYAEIAAEITKKYTEITVKDLGYITVLSLPYNIENLVYNLKPGGLTLLYRTKSALHYFKNIEERKSAGKWKIAQVLLSIPPNASADELKATKDKADSIYKLLIDGADFPAIAKEFSEDKLTYLNGGEMPEFGTGKFELPFETEVFKLQKTGEISKPVLTDYGYHIVKLLEHHDIPADKSDEAFVAALKQQILRDSRIDAAKANFLRLVKVKAGYKRNPLIKDADLFRYADSITATGGVKIYPVNNKVIFSFAKLNVKGIDWLNFIKDYKFNTDVYKGEGDKELLDKYISTTSFEYYRKHLEEYNSDFKYQMEEFKEGNMLFEIMERNVWSKAVNDSIGLQKFYDAHQESYKWGASADILLFNCSDGKAAADAAAALKDGKNWKEIADESAGKVQSDSGRYELSQVQLTAGTVLTEGLITAPYINSSDHTTSFVKVLKMFPSSQQRSFEEAKGLVINDYQTYLEDKWVDELKKKYPIRLNDTVFQSLLNNL